MDKNRILLKLEQDLSHFLISEACKNDPTKRGTPEMYKYKGLSLSTNEKSKDATKTVGVNIGALEAKFKISNGDKVSGNLSPQDEGMIQIWLAQSENTSMLRTIFAMGDNKKNIAILPFDLEEFYTKS